MSTKSKKEGAAFDFHLIGRIIRLALPHKKLLLGSIFFVVLLTVLAPIRPILVQLSIDEGMARGDKDAIWLFSGLILLHLGVQSLTVFGHTYITNLLGQKVIKDLRMRVYNHILSLNSAFFDRSKVGTLVTRSVSDVETISSFFSEGFISIVGDLAQIVTILALMFYTNWELTLISLAVMPILLVASEIFRRGVRKSFQVVRQQVSRLNAFVQEQIVGMEVVQIFGKEEQEFKKFELMNRMHRDAYKQSISYYAVYFPVVDILSSLSLALVIWWVAGAPSIGSAGLIASFYLYVQMIFRPIRFIADRFNTMQMGVVASERIFDLIDDNGAQENKGTTELSSVRGAIVFDHVWFAYTDEDYVLKDLSFELEAGKSLAIVGATGAGKSSLINLITRLYTIQKGAITIDGHNVNDLNIKTLRNHVGVVLQDVFLFAGSIADNVNLKNKHITQHKMNEAAASIDALTFIQELGKGWEYEVMERGNSLSVGQRQLISFIRAMAADPSVLILDEATSSVDSETEELIQAATQKLMMGRTSIVIAHRLSTVREADTILVLDKGRAVERGNHEELIKQEGAYYELFQKQFELT